VDDRRRWAITRGWRVQEEASSSDEAAVDVAGAASDDASADDAAVVEERAVVVPVGSSRSVALTDTEGTQRDGAVDV
jgi:hypothetical protein